MRQIGKLLSCLVCVSALWLSSCAPPNSSGQSDNTGQVAGTVAGVVLGGLLGNAIGGGLAATLIGGAVGGLIGNRIGAALDDQSKQRHEAAIKNVVTNPDSGQQDWQLAQQGTSGSVTPMRSFSQDGKQCTEVKQTVYNKGQTITDTNSYCKQADGSVTLLN